MLAKRTTKRRKRPLRLAAALTCSLDQTIAQKRVANAAQFTRTIVVRLTDLLQGFIPRHTSFAQGNHDRKVATRLTIAEYGVGETHFGRGTAEQAVASVFVVMLGHCFTNRCRDDLLFHSIVPHGSVPFVSVKLKKAWPIDHALGLEVTEAWYKPLNRDHQQQMQQIRFNRFNLKYAMEDVIAQGRVVLLAILGEDEHRHLHIRHLHIRHPGFAISAEGFYTICIDAIVAGNDLFTILLTILLIGRFAPLHKADVVAIVGFTHVHHPIEEVVAERRHSSVVLS